ncbi:MAG: transposase [Usitatibacter sp.]
MARRHRLSIDGLPLHIVQRGNDRQRCFFEDSHYSLYLGLMTELARPHGCEVHAYVLMTNHVHLLLTPQVAGNASRFMKNLAQRYVQSVNRTRQRTGTLWDGRFKSCLVESETYALRCYRYIEMNPLRAGMVGDPSHHPWSSFSANALGIPSLSLVPHPVYQALGRDDRERRAAYCALFDRRDDHDIEDIRSALRTGTPLGTPPFMAQLALRGIRVHPGQSGRRPRNRGQTPISVQAAMPRAGISPS